MQEPFVLKSLKVVTFNELERIVQISMSTDALGNGYTNINLDVPAKMKPGKATYRIENECAIKAGSINRNWEVSVPEDGYYALETTLYI
jgi:hypothetical protein